MGSAGPPICTVPCCPETSAPGSGLAWSTPQERPFAAGVSAGERLPCLTPGGPQHVDPEPPHATFWLCVSRETGHGSYTPSSGHSGLFPRLIGAILEGSLEGVAPTDSGHTALYLKAGRPVPTSPYPVLSVQLRPLLNSNVHPQTVSILGSFPSLSQGTGLVTWARHHVLCTPLHPKAGRPLPSLPALQGSCLHPGLHPACSLHPPPPNNSPSIPLPPVPNSIPHAPHQGKSLTPQPPFSKGHLGCPSQ